jgi:hypothetical protein
MGSGLAINFSNLVIEVHKFSPHPPELNIYGSHFFFFPKQEDKT